MRRIMRLKFVRQCLDGGCRLKFKSNFKMGMRSRGAHCRSVWACPGLGGARAVSASRSLRLAPSAAWAGAWTLPQGNGQIIQSFFGWQGTGAPWGNGAPGQSLSRVEAQTYIEYGLSNEITLFGQIAAERYDLSPPQANVYTGLDYSDIGVRTKVWSNDAWVFSFEATAFIPGAHDAAKPAQAGNTGWAGEARALAGRNLTIFNIPAFIDAEAGYRLRSEGPPDEWHADITLGLKPTTRIMWLLQVFNTISTNSTDPQFPPGGRASGSQPCLCAGRTLVRPGRRLHDDRDREHEHGARDHFGGVAEVLRSPLPE